MQCQTQQKLYAQGRVPVCGPRKGVGDTVPRHVQAIRLAQVRSLDFNVTIRC